MVANVMPSLGTGGLDFAMVAVFVSMIASSIRKRSDWVAIGLAVLVAFTVHNFMGGYWHLFAAGILVPLIMSISFADHEKNVTQDKPGREQNAN
jgi:predicted branched-subunit amino acid permease